MQFMEATQFASKGKTTLILAFEVIVLSLVHTLFIISILLYSLTIEQFLMYPFSVRASCHSALVSKIAL